MNESHYVFVSDQLSDVVRLPVLSLSWVACVNGVFGNVLIITTLLSQPALRSLHNIYIGNLAVADLILTGYCMPFWLVDVTSGHYPVLNKTHCIVNSFMTSFAFLTSVLTLVAISVNRYFHVCRHSVFVRVFTKQRTLGLCVLTWVVSFFLSLNHLLGISSLYRGYDSRLGICVYTSTDDFNLWVAMVMPLILPSVIVGFTNASIFNHWRRSRSRMQKWRQGPTSCRSEDGSKVEMIVELSEHDTVFPESAGENADDSLVNGCSSAEDVIRAEVNTASFENRCETGCCCANLDYEVCHLHNHKQNLPSNGGISDQPEDKSVDELSASEAEGAQHNPDYILLHTLETATAGHLAHSHSHSVQRANNVILTAKATKIPDGETRKTTWRRTRRSDRQHLTASDISLVRSLLIVFVCCVILYLPLAVATIVEKFRPISPDVNVWAVACTFFNHCINWIVYGLMNRSFREGYKQQFVFCFRKCLLRT